MHTWEHMNVKIFVRVCLKRLRSRVMSRNTSEKANMLIYRLTRCQFSPPDEQRSVTGYPEADKDIRSCPKRCLLMPLARVGARTDSTTYTQREAWPISEHGSWYYVRYAPRRGCCTLVLFIMLSNTEACSLCINLVSGLLHFPGVHYKV